jgi:hypothetical protein
LKLPLVGFDVQSGAIEIDIKPFQGLKLKRSQWVGKLANIIEIDIKPFQGLKLVSFICRIYLLW